MGLHVSINFLSINFLALLNLLWVSGKLESDYYMHCTSIYTCILDAKKYRGTWGLYLLHLHGTYRKTNSFEFSDCHASLGVISLSR